MDRDESSAARSAKTIGGIGAVFLIAYVVVILLTIGGTAWPHHVPDTDGLVYDRGCCNSAATHPTGDCAPIDDQYVSERADGYHINIPVGGHPKLKDRGYSAIIPYSDVKQPLDNRYHICLSSVGYRYCFYPKPGAV